ncbi:MAG: type I-G CRISPR-associated protein, Cas3-extension family [Candidatus Binataceae bacterium]
MRLLDPPGDTLTLPMPGLEPDNLLGFMALLGLLRTLEAARPNWEPRASWKGTPWTAQLHLAAFPEPMQVAQAAIEGIATLLERFDIDKRKNVDFAPEEYRTYAKRMRRERVEASLASALTAEWPQNRKADRSLSAAPLVMMFGQGHQNFLDRLIDVPSGALPNRLRKLKSPPDLADPAKIAQTLFQPWRHEDDADGFRWDPEDDQRYALRYDDPSLSGAAPTVVGANRLAAIGFLSFAIAPRAKRMKAVGAIRDDGEWLFVWPIWLPRFSRVGIEALLAHSDLLSGERSRLQLLGVAEIFRARRVSNGKFMNVARARPVEG